MVGVRLGDAPRDTRVMYEQAEADGYKFIELKLLKNNYNGMQGAEVLVARQGIDHVSGATTFNFGVTGGPLQFERSEGRAGLLCKMVDTEWNRKFLRNQLSSANPWFEVVDKALAAEIAAGALSEGAAEKDSGAETKTENPPPPPPPKPAPRPKPAAAPRSPAISVGKK